MILSTVFYIFIAFAAAFLLNEGKKHEGSTRGRLFVAASLLLLTAVAAVRYGIGTDFYSYTNVYNEMLKVSIGGAPTVVGSGGQTVWIIAKLASFMGGTVAFYALFELLTVTLFWLGLREYDLKDHFMPMFIFVMMFYPTSFNIMRQVLSAAIVFFALRYVYRRKILIFVILVVIASNMHTTAITFLPVYIIWLIIDRKGSRLFIDEDRSDATLAAVYSITAAICLTVPYFITELSGKSHFFYYLNFAEGSSNFSYIISSVLLLLMIVFARKTIYGDMKMNMLLILAALGTGIDAIGYFSFDIKRLSLYFFPLPAAVIIGAICERCPERYRKPARILAMAGAVAWFVLFFVIANQGQVSPYRSIFTK